MSKDNAKSYLDYMQVDDLPENMQPIAEKIGLENVLSIIEELGGLEIYFPLMKSITSKARDRVVFKEHQEQHYSVNQLAKRHNLSSVWVRQIIKEAQVKQKSLNKEKSS